MVKYRTRRPRRARPRRRYSRNPSFVPKNLFKRLTNTAIDGGVFILSEIGGDVAVGGIKKIEALDKFLTDNLGKENGEGALKIFVGLFADPLLRMVGLKPHMRSLFALANVTGGVRLLARDIIASIKESLDLSGYPQGGSWGDYLPAMSAVGAYEDPPTY